MALTSNILQAYYNDFERNRIERETALKNRLYADYYASDSTEKSDVKEPQQQNNKLLLLL